MPGGPAGAVLTPLYQPSIQRFQQGMKRHAGKLVDVEELVMPAGGTHQAPKPMVPVNRPVGQNDVGMIAWVLTLRTPECPQGRKVSVPSHCPSCLCGGSPCTVIAAFT